MSLSLPQILIQTATIHSPSPKSGLTDQVQKSPPMVAFNLILWVLSSSQTGWEPLVETLLKLLKVLLSTGKSTNKNEDEKMHL